MNGLAGPLHGLANQEVLVWLTKLQEELGGEVSDAELRDFIWNTLASGQVRSCNLIFINNSRFTLIHVI